jgi:heme-degrading monooxygenase HmoA
VYVTVTSAKTSDQPIENATIVAEEMMRWLRDIEGFEGFLMLSQEGRTLGLSFWESREAAEHHRVARAQFRERMLSVADVEIEDSSDFEVTFADLGRRLAELSR